MYLTFPQARQEREELETEKKLFTEKSTKLDAIMRQVKGLTSWCSGDEVQIFCYLFKEIVLCNLFSLLTDLRFNILLVFFISISSIQIQNYYFRSHYSAED